MKLFCKILRSLPVFILTLVLTSCVTEQVGPKLKTRPPIGGDFPKLSDYRLALYPVGNRNFIDGQTADLNLCLKNVGGNAVYIPEWYMNTPDNVKIYYRPYDEAIDAFEPTQWQCLAPEIKPDAYHFRLSLHPGNSVFITKELPLREMLKTNAPEGRYLLVGELSLSSVSLRSPMFEISIK